MKLSGILLTLILVVILCEGVRKRQDRRQNNKPGLHQRQLAQEQHQQHPQQQRRPRRQQQQSQRQQQQPQRQQRQQQSQRQQQQSQRQPRQQQEQQQQQKSQGRGRPRPAAARRPRVGPPAAAIGSNLPDLKKLPNTKFECDESKR